MAIERALLDTRMATFRQILARERVTATPQRTEIYREVARTEEHPDAELVRKRLLPRMPHLSLDTVYRALALFEALGLIRKVEALNDRARYDANMDRHHHFVCTRCGLVRDFESKAADRLTPPKELRKFGTIHSQHLQYRGVCTACAKRTRGRG